MIIQFRLLRRSPFAPGKDGAAGPGGSGTVLRVIGAYVRKIGFKLD